MCDATRPTMHACYAVASSDTDSSSATLLCSAYTHAQVMRTTAQLRRRCPTEEAISTPPSNRARRRRSSRGGSVLQERHAASRAAHSRRWGRDLRNLRRHGAARGALRVSRDGGRGRADAVPASYIRTQTRVLQRRLHDASRGSLRLRHGVVARNADRGGRVWKRFAGRQSFMSSAPRSRRDADLVPRRRRGLLSEADCGRELHALGAVVPLTAFVGGKSVLESANPSLKRPRIIADDGSDLRSLDSSTQVAMRVAPRRTSGRHVLRRSCRCRRFAFRALMHS